jgi:hypothetical protein
MRYLTSLLSLLALMLCGSNILAATTRPVREDGVVLAKKTFVIVRRGKVTRDFPEKKRATVSYPVVTGGLSSPAVLSKVRSLLSVKNIFDTSIEEYRQDTWLSEFDYKVNYNKNYILDITFTQSGSGAYPSTDNKHLAINLKTGRLIKAADVFKSDSLENLAAMVDKKLQAEIKETLDEVARDKDYDAEAKKSIREMFESLKIGPQDLDNFSINDKGITFLYDAGFPHVAQALQPVGEYFFSYAGLSPYLKRKGSAASLVQ